MTSVTTRCRQRRSPPKRPPPSTTACREFLAANTSTGRAPRPRAPPSAFQAALAEAGLAGLTYPRSTAAPGSRSSTSGSTGRSPRSSRAMAGELVISHGMCLPILNEFGTDEQKRRFMPDNIAGAHGVVPDVLRARRRLRRRQPPDPGRARRRRVGDQRAEGVDHARPRVRLRHPHRPHRPRAAQARRDLDVHRRHAGRPASRSGRSTRSTAAVTSTRCSSPTSASPPTGWSASSTTAGARRRRC